MMRYLDRKFSVAAPDSEEYREGWERIFGQPECTAPGAECDAESPCLKHRCGAQDCFCYLPEADRA